MRRIRNYLAMLALLQGAGAAYALTVPEAGIADFKAYAADHTHSARVGAENLLKTLEAGDIAGAKAAWFKSRDGWEKCETVSGTFGDLDKAIDAWPDGKSGYHAIEAKLFGGASAKDIVPMAKDLVENLKTFEQKLKEGALPTQDLYNGMAQLAYEVGESKSKGNESRLSGSSLRDMRNNIEGVTVLYDKVFSAAVLALNPETEKRVRAQLALVNADLSVDSIDKIDPKKLEKNAEMLAVVFLEKAGDLGLQQPKLESED